MGARAMNGPRMPLRIVKIACDVLCGIDVTNTAAGGGSYPPPEWFGSGRWVGFDKAHQLFVHELLNAHRPQLAAIARILDAAKGKIGVQPIDVVYEHHPRICGQAHLKTWVGHSHAHRSFRLASRARLPINL